MSPAARKLLMERLSSEIQALETGKLKMRSSMAFVLKQQVTVNRMLDELALAEPGAEKNLRKRVSI